MEIAFCSLWVPVEKESIFSWSREELLSSDLSRIDKNGRDLMSISFPQPLQRDVFVSLLSEVTVLALIGNAHISAARKYRYGSHISYYCMLAKPNSLATQHSYSGLNSNCR